MSFNTNSLPSSSTPTSLFLYPPSLLLSSSTPLLSNSVVSPLSLICPLLSVPSRSVNSQGLTLHTGLRLTPHTGLSIIAKGVVLQKY